MGLDACGGAEFSVKGPGTHEVRLGGDSIKRSNPGSVLLMSQYDTTDRALALPSRVATLDIPGVFASSGSRS